MTALFFLCIVQIIVIVFGTVVRLVAGYNRRADSSVFYPWVLNFICDSGAIRKLSWGILKTLTQRDLCGLHKVIIGWYLSM